MLKILAITVLLGLSIVGCSSDDSTPRPVRTTITFPVEGIVANYSLGHDLPVLAKDFPVIVVADVINASTSGHQSSFDGRTPNRADPFEGYYTHYQVHIQYSLGDSSVSAADTITFIGAGGIVDCVAYEYPLEVSDNHLLQQGHTYLMFLSYAPSTLGTNDYAAPPEAIYELRDSKFVALNLPKGGRLPRTTPVTGLDGLTLEEATLVIQQAIDAAPGSQPPTAAPASIANTLNAESLGPGDCSGESASATPPQESIEPSQVETPSATPVGSSTTSASDTPPPPTSQP